MPTTRTYTTKIVRDGSMCFIPVPFDPKEAFGKVRAPVKVTVNAYTYRSTIAAMGGVTCIPLRKSNREAAGLEGNEELEIQLELDEDERTVEVPTDLAEAIAKANAGAAWDKLSYTHKREHVEAIEGAKQPETRWRRIAAALAMLGATFETKASKAKSKPAKASKKSKKATSSKKAKAKAKSSKSKPARR